MKSIGQLIIISCILFGFVGCNELEEVTSTPHTANNTSSTVAASAGNVTITPLDDSVTTQSQLRDNYDVSTFSKYILWHKSADKVLIDYNFFPEGSDLCQQATYNATTNPNGCKQAKTIVMPCEFQSINDDGFLSISLNASPDGEEALCVDNIVIDLSQAQFYADGLVFSYDVSLNVFADVFEFKIFPAGFIDAFDNQLLPVKSDDLEITDVYDQIIAKRVSSED